MNQTTQTESQDNADTQVLTVSPNRWATWTGKGFYGDTPEPVPNVSTNFIFEGFLIRRPYSTERNGDVWTSERTTSTLKTER
jgi:hypothetical protein